MKFNIFIILLLVMFSVQFVACNTSSHRSRTPVSTPEEKEETDGNKEEKDDTDKTDESSVPPYMLTVAEAKALPLNTAYITPGGQKPALQNIDASYNPFSLFATSFLNEFITTSDYTFKRTFEVKVYNDLQANASMDTWQRMLIHKGALQKINYEGLLDVICHEVGHSITNNGLEITQFYNAKMNAMPLIVEIMQYLDQTAPYDTCWNDAGVIKCIYTHNKSKYQNLLNRWKTESLELAFEMKKNEARTDYLGGVICSKMGVSTERLGVFHNSGTDYEIQYEGETLNNGGVYHIEDEYLFVALFPYESHPKESERMDQFNRLRELFAEQYDSTSTYATRWKDNYVSLGGCSSCATYGLTGHPSPDEVLTISSEDGSEIKLYKPVLDQMKKHLPSRRR